MANELTTRQLQPGTNRRRQAWSSEIATQRHALYRDCPITEVIDRGHALARVAGVMQGGHGSTNAAGAPTRRPPVCGEGRAQETTAQWGPRHPRPAALRARAPPLPR